jgi:hypothetical protein
MSCATTRSCSCRATSVASSSPPTWPARSPAASGPRAPLVDGDLSHRNRQIFEALLAAYHGDLAGFCATCRSNASSFSRRYRQSVATVEPQMAVDVRTRQLSMDRSLSSLPSALQTVSLFEMQGELVDANRGMLDFEDLLKRPFESWKYLLAWSKTAPPRSISAPWKWTRCFRHLEREFPGRLQGSAGIPVVQGPHGAGARALSARRAHRKADLRRARRARPRRAAGGTSPRT